MNDMQLPADGEKLTAPTGAQAVSVLNLDGSRKSDFVIDEVPAALVYNGISHIPTDMILQSFWDTRSQSPRASTAKRPKPGLPDE